MMEMLQPVGFCKRCGHAMFESDKGRCSNRDTMDDPVDCATKQHLADARTKRLMKQKRLFKVHRP